MCHALIVIWSVRAVLRPSAALRATPQESGRLLSTSFSSPVEIGHLLEGRPV